MYRQCPTAVVAAREDEALTHGQVLYGLIKPTKDMDMVESTAAMVNVIPKKRIYRMEEHEEIDLFLKELMKRPLVLQPSAYIGRGIAAIGCTLCTAEERWILLINQVHPKVRGRIQMGIDTAKSKMEHGEPFVIKLTFNEYLKRIYLDHLTRTALDARFTFIDFEDAEIIIRYPGDRYHRGLSWEMKAQDIVLSFDDLLPSELTRRTVSVAQSEWRNPALRVIMPDEMCTFLPGWDFEMVDPLAGVDSPDDEGLEDEAVGGVELPPEPAPTGRVLGRAQRKGKAAAGTHHVPVELHVPEPNGPQKLHRGGNPASPVSLGRGRSTSPSSRPYEDLQRDQYRNEHTYEHTRVQNSHMPPTRDSPYEEMNMHRQQYSSHDAPPSYNSVSHIAPRTPTAPRQHTPTQQSAYSPHSPHGPPRTPRSPHSPASPYSPHTPSTPHTPRTPHTPNTPHSPPPSADRYNTDYTAPQSSRQTYLTDDSVNSSQPQRQQYSGHKYDSNFNKSAEMDRYGDRYNPQDKYADKSFQPVPSPRGNFPPTHRPTVSPRGLHHHQGSGRSDTSASDSGFGESEESRQRHNNRYNTSNGIDRSNTPTKTPYYNHAFQHSPDSPDKHITHPMTRQGHDGYRKQEFYSDDKYGHELQKWRQNINDLEEACDVPRSDFRGTQLRMNSNNEEPMEESFI